MGAFGFGHELALGRWRPGMAPAFEFGSGGLPVGATLTRASGGRRWDASGTSVVEPNDAARLDFDPASLAFRGLLIEPAQTNLLLRSAEFDNGSWNAMRTTVTANAATAPDGTAAADRVVPTAVAGSHTVQQAGTFTSGTAYAFSVWLKAAGRRYARLSLPGAAFPATGRAGFFDLTAGAVIGAEAGIAATMDAASGGWFRCAIARTATASGSGDSGIAVNLTNVQSLESWTGNGVDGVLAWGAQLEAAAAPSSHIATGAATAARAADTLVLDWASRGVGNGAATVRCTFDDGSTQDLGVTIAGGTAAMPAALNRAWLRRAERI